MQFFKKLISGQVNSQDIDPDFSKNIQEIETHLLDFPREKATKLACLALVLGQVAHADHDISDSEKEALVEILIQDTHLDQESAQMVAGLAAEKTIQRTMESHIPVRKLKEITSNEERDDLMRALFHVAKVDGITEIESNQIRTISRGLGFSQSEFSTFRAEFQDHLDVLKGK